MLQINHRTKERRRKKRTNMLMRLLLMITKTVVPTTIKITLFVSIVARKVILLSSVGKGQIWDTTNVIVWDIMTKSVGITFLSKMKLKWQINRRRSNCLWPHALLAAVQANAYSLIVSAPTTWPMISKFSRCLISLKCQRLKLAMRSILLSKAKGK